jgi:hypothetical protein
MSALEGGGQGGGDNLNLHNIITNWYLQMKDMNPGKKICSFLEKKLALFNKYLSITKRMKESLKGKEAGNQGVYISERQDCIKRIERIDLSMEKIIKASSDKRSDISYQFKVPTMPSYLQGVSYEQETLKGEEGLAHPPRLSESDAGQAQISFHQNFVDFSAFLWRDRTSGTVVREIGVSRKDF